MTKLLRHMEAMQTASTDRLSSASSHRADSDFIGTITEMLDGPAQREAQFDFLSLSARTVSGGFHGQFVPMYALREAFEDFMTAGERLDVIKKLIFYGEDKAKGRVSLVRTADLGDYNAYVALGALTAAARTSDSEDLSGGSEAVKRAELILHAVLGVATEAAEMVEAVYKAVFEGGELDLTNLLEESGDTKWYLAILARVMGVDWDEDERRIIAKLMKRYADKFNPAEANNRDLFAERQVLERPAITEQPRKHVGTIKEMIEEGTYTEAEASKIAINTGDCACGQGGSWGHASGCPETDTPLEYPTA